jgi:Spy/CpxP family protein refolding chaperone
MKTRTFLTQLVVAGLLCGAGIPVLAQAPGGGGGGARGGMLNAEQFGKLRESSQASRTELTALTEKLAEAQKAAVKAATAKNADEKTVRTAVEAVSKIQTDIALLRFKAVKEIAPTLTDEQKTQMEARPGMAYNMLLGGFGGGMGGGMGGPQGGGRRGGAGGGAGGAGGGGGANR